MRRLMASVIVILALGAAISGAAEGQGLPTRKEGLRQYQPGVWIDEAAGPKQQARIAARVATARQKVRKALGTVGGPEWRICATKACDRRNGLYTRGMTYGALVITLDSSAVAEQGAYTHELTHATLHGAVSVMGILANALPLWFDEGVAVLVSGEPPKAADRKACAKPPRVRLPNTARDFQRDTGSDPDRALPVYIASTCAVRQWIGQGNRLRDVMPQLRSGRRVP